MEILTRQEEYIMIYFWKKGASFVREILNELPEPTPPYTSVASIIRNLEKKKYLRSRKLGNSIQYFPQIAESEYKRHLLSTVVKNYFTGSYKEMVSFFIRDHHISEKDLKEMINLIEENPK